MTESKKETERRSARRRPIMETFAIFVVVPRKGMHKLQAHDVSESGIAFDFDIEGESPTDVLIKKGDHLEIQFYLNQSLYIPLSLQVMRISPDNPNRRIGAEFQNKASPQYKALLALLKLLDDIADVIQTT
jgi:hypothetical protein